MKTNVSIELTDEERGLLANLIDGKMTSRKASRKEVVAICQQHIAGLVRQSWEPDTYQVPDGSPAAKEKIRLEVIDDEDYMFLKDKPPSYVRGWNQVKRGKK